MSELTRQERFSMSRQFAKELVAGSIITDAAAQFLALIIQEIHDTKIAPLQAELNRRADMLTTLAAAMELPEVRSLVRQYEMLLEDLTDHGGYTYEDDFGADLAAIAAIKETKA